MASNIGVGSCKICFLLFILAHFYCHSGETAPVECSFESLVRKEFADGATCINKTFLPFRDSACEALAAVANKICQNDKLKFKKFKLDDFTLDLKHVCTDISTITVFPEDLPKFFSDPKICDFFCTYEKTNSKLCQFLLVGLKVTETVSLTDSKDPRAQQGGSSNTGKVATQTQTQTPLSTGTGNKNEDTSTGIITEKPIIDAHRVQTAALTQKVNEKQVISKEDKDKPNEESIQSNDVLAKDATASLNPPKTESNIDTDRSTNTEDGLKTGKSQIPEVENNEKAKVQSKSVPDENGKSPENDDEPSANEKTTILKQADELTTTNEPETPQTGPKNVNEDANSNSKTVKGNSDVKQKIPNESDDKESKVTSKVEDKTIKSDSSVKVEENPVIPQSNNPDDTLNPPLLTEPKDPSNDEDDDSSEDLEVETPITEAKSKSDGSEKGAAKPEKSPIAPEMNVVGQMPADFPEYGDSHFFVYFLTAVVLSVILYLAFHNKQKIIALIIEGRHERRRRPNNVGYKKLDSNLDEVLSGKGSSVTTPAHIIY